ncbi:MAG: aminotransferase class [Gemmatimonadetes bacterium]|jgi:aspartate aminotransferase-like enzyme|nr:aminotransferase class [Gemmatimonadota bacterium]
MTALLTDGRFFFPGPTEVRHEVLAAMARPMIPHRGAEFSAIFANMQVALKQIFGTARPVYVSSSSATGLMEAAMRSAPPGRILSIVNGAFSERFAAIARSCGRETDVIEVPWGEVVAPDVLEQRLSAQRYAAVTVAHSETSTGALTDVRAVTRMARAHGARCLVDSVTGVGGAPLEFDAWELDLVLTGSQKALALPPGLAFLACTSEYIAAAPATPGRGLYFDLVEFEESTAKNQTPNTPAISLFYAAEVQLAAIASEGMPARWARHAAMAARTQRWAEGLAATHGDPALGVLAGAAHRSPTVTSVTLPARVPGSTLVKAVKERGFTIGTGYGTNRETTVRVGHMGDHTLPALERCLAACDEALAELKA